MHFDTATRQRWMSVLAHSEPQDLLARMQSLQLAPLQSPRHFHTLMETLITPLEALRSARIEARRAEVNASRVDFFTLVRGDNV